MSNESHLHPSAAARGAPHPRARQRGSAGAGCIHELVEASVARDPGAVAVAWGAETVAYGELDARAGRLARRLRGLGVGPETVVGVFLERTPEMVAALLGILKAGGAYLPLDPAYPPGRVAFMLEDAGAALVLTQEWLAGRLPPFPGEVVVLGGQALVGGPAPSRANEFAATTAQSPPSRTNGNDSRTVVLPSPLAGEGSGEGGTRGAPEPRPAAVSPENLAYVIYTSGSTGRPRGVEIEHRNAVAALRWMLDAFPEEDRASLLASTSICFDVSVAEIFLALAGGGRMTLVENALALAALPPGAGVRMASMVPSAAAELVRLGGIPPTVRTLALGGEPLPPALADAAYRATGARRVFNLYGPSEDTTYSTCSLVPRGADAVRIGRPVTGSRGYVLDAELVPVPEGAAGELYLGGAGVSRGYRRAPDRTAERWLPDPFAGEPGARMYRTGDRVRLAPDGELEYLGRLDHQVKVRGHRVELGEVEAVLRAHPGVREAVADAREEAAGSRVLAAYLVADDPAPPLAELRAWTAERLPEYMVPTAWTLLPALPRTPSGKPDRGALPVPAAARPEDAGPYVAPRTPAEEVLAGIWSEVLGAGAVGVRDSFFELGGHSLRATQVLARVRQALAVELPLSVLFEHDTVEALAREVERASGAGEALPPLRPAPRGGPIPLSAAQEAALLFQELAVAGAQPYAFQGAVRFAGALDAGTLERTLTEIVRRHEVFRTEFVRAPGGPVQEVRAPWPVRLHTTDLRGLPPERREAELERRVREESVRPFIPDRLPLVRWRLFRPADDEHVLLAVEHHFVHDGWSFGVFLHELTALYAAFLRGGPSPLPEPSVQFADFAVWQREWLRTHAARAQLDFWREELTPLPAPLDLPSDRPRPPEMSFRGATRRVRLHPALAEAAAAFSRRRGATLFMTLLAAFQALLARWSGRTEFCVGSGAAARSTRESEGLIGMVVNTLALRADLAGDPSFAGLLERVRRTTLRAYAHQDVPFGRVVEEVQPERAPDRLPVYQVAFSFHHAPYPELRVPGAVLEVTEALGNGSAKFDLQVIAVPRGEQGAGGGAGEVTMIWEHSTDLFDPSTIERMARGFETLLAAALARPDAPVSALPLLPAGERRRVLEEWNATARPYALDVPVHRLFEEHAARAPHAPALSGGGAVLTYAEADRMAEGVARRLRALGVGPETRVAVCLERGPELAVALLAVWKAGGACLPLDPEHPAGRIALTVRDARAPVLVTRTGVLSALPEGPRALLLDEPDEAEDAAAPAAEVSPESAAYVVYTSGSTGAPKGVVVEHRQLASLAAWYREAMELAPADRGSQVAGPAFDALAWELWPFLSAGASVHFADGETRLSAERAVEWIAERGITVAFLPTPLAERALRLPWPDDAELRVLLAGGDRLHFAPPPGLPFSLLNGYGPTECTVVSTAAWVPPGEGVPPIGRPIANDRAYVLDGRLEPVPPGVPGELYLGGAGVARGYLDRPDATAEHFVPDPFSGEAGARMYRSGDRARWRSGGELEFLGRVDRQVKLRGFRVEPGEVEAALDALPGVREAVVEAREDAPGEVRLVAYVVPGEGEATEPAALRAALGERLPSYMVPSAWVLMDALPLTANGKTDRAALPRPAPGTGRVAEPALPASPVAARIAEIWGEVLGVPRVGARDDFFALGGHSLLAAEVVARVRRAFRVELPLRDLFAAPTVEALARRVEEASRRGTGFD